MSDYLKGLEDGREFAKMLNERFYSYPCSECGEYSPHHTFWCSRNPNNKDDYQKGFDEGYKIYKR